MKENDVILKVFKIMLFFTCILDECRTLVGLYDSYSGLIVPFFVLSTRGLCVGTVIGAAGEQKPNRCVIFRDNYNILVQQDVGKNRPASKNSSLSFLYAIYLDKT